MNSSQELNQTDSSTTSSSNNSSSNSNFSSTFELEKVALVNMDAEEDKNKRKRRRKIEEQPLEVKTWIFKQEKVDDKQYSPMPVQSPRSASSTTGYDFWKENYQQTSSNERTAIKRERILVGQLPNTSTAPNAFQNNWDSSPATTSSSQSEMTKSKSFEIFHWQLEKPSSTPSVSSPNTSPPFQKSLISSNNNSFPQTSRQRRGSQSGTTYEVQEDYTSLQNLTKQLQEELSQVKQENTKLKSQIEILMKLQQQQLQTSQIEPPAQRQLSALNNNTNSVLYPPLQQYLLNTNNNAPNKFEFPLPNLNALYPPSSLPSIRNNNPSTNSLPSIQPIEQNYQHQSQSEGPNKQSSHR